MKSLLIKMTVLLFVICSFSFKIKTVNSVEFLYYKITVETIFSEKDESAIIEKMKGFLPDAEIMKVKYQEKQIIVKVSKETVYDQIKSGFDKVGIRITREESFTKYED